MAQGRRRKCKCCRRLFRPDPRNRHHQRYCSQPRCRELPGLIGLDDIDSLVPRIAVVLQISKICRTSCNSTRVDKLPRI